MFNKFNLLTYTYLTCLAMSFLKFSDYYDHSLSLQLYVFLLLIFITNFCFSFIDRKIVSNTQFYNPEFNLSGKRRYIIDIFLISYFCIDVWHTETLAINELLNLRDYKAIDHIFGYSLLFLPLTMTRVMVLFESRKSKLNKLLIILYFLIFIANVSRIITFITTIVLIISQLIIFFKRRKIGLSRFLNIKVIGTLALVLFTFGIMGEFKSSASRNYEKAEKNKMTVIRYLSSPNKSFDKLNISDNFLWPYVYCVSPIYNLDNALKANNTKDIDILIKSFTPNFVYRKFLKIKKDKSFLLVDTFNTSTMYGELIYGFGIYVGLIYHFFLCCIVLCCSKIVQKLRSQVLSIFITVFLCLTTFSNVLLKEIFIMTIFFFWMSKINFYIRSK